LAIQINYRSMAQQPIPSIEIYDLDDAFKKIQQLEATNDYLRRRYVELHTEYRQQEQAHDHAKTSNVAKQRRIEELEEEVQRLKFGKAAREVRPGEKTAADDKIAEDEIKWKMCPKSTEARERRLREEETKEIQDQKLRGV
jgi:hypothetical protein